MSFSISTLLIRNIHDVLGEDGVFCDPKTCIHRGRDEIDRVPSSIRATHPDFQYQLVCPGLFRIEA